MQLNPGELNAPGTSNSKLDPTFKDTRIALNAGWEQPWRQDSRRSVGDNFSGEHDFVSASVKAALAHDYNEKNTTASLGLALEFDTIKPEGGVPQGLQPMFGQAQKAASGQRTVIDVLTGVTQVMSRTWLMQVNYSLGRSSGYHTDPYKLLSGRTCGPTGRARRTSTARSWSRVWTTTARPAAPTWALPRPTRAWRASAP
jgi:hypothetical protein